MFCVRVIGASSSAHNDCLGRRWEGLAIDIAWDGWTSVGGVEDGRGKRVEDVLGLF